MADVAALYVDPRGPYPELAAAENFGLARRPSIDCWDLSRDARKYEGPYPVVAHPPCKHWGRLRHLATVECKNLLRHRFRACDLEGLGACPYCGSTLIDYGDRDCALRAVEQVRAFGGVLEHPAGSKLWDACGLPAPHPCAGEPIKGRCAGTAAGCPARETDAFGGYTIELDQCEWGHVARKRTWLYLVGVPREALEAPPYPGREPTHYASGGRTTSSRTGGAIPAGMKVCSAQQRRRTPPLFAEYLVRLARSAAHQAREAAHG